MARSLIHRLSTTCVVGYLLGGCGGDVADVGHDDVGGGPFGVGGYYKAGGAYGYGGATKAFGGMGTGGQTIFYGSGGRPGVGGAYYGPGGSYYGTGGRSTTVGGTASGGKGGVSSGGISSGGKAAGGVSGFSTKGGTAGYTTFVAGSSPRGGTAGTTNMPKGGVAGTLGYGGTSGGMGSSAGAPPTAGASGCPAIIPTCSYTCPLARWTEVTGCSSCACEPPPKQLGYYTSSCPADSLTVATTVTQQSATWVFSFVWTCSVTASTMEQPLGGSVSVTILNSTADPIGTADRTYFAASMVITQPQIVLPGSGLPQVTQPLTAGSTTYLSIRREGSQFVGGIYLPGTTTLSVPATLAGPFTVAVPTSTAVQ